MQTTLEQNSGQYQLEVSGTAGSLSKAFDLGDESVYLGVLTLTG